jgi:hypothetical protein
MYKLASLGDNGGIASGLADGRSATSLLRRVDAIFDVI